MAPKKAKSKKNTTHKRRVQKFEHLYSTVVTDFPTKSNHKKREYYPILISDIHNPASVGSDGDVRMVGYSIRLDLPTGNDTRTVSAALGHAGAWIRIGTSDAFNQQHETRSFSRKTLVFQKRVLPSSEREFVSPQTSDSSLVLQLDDPMGVIPGISVKVTARLHYVRRIMPAFMPKADEPATDRYEDQDINGASTAPPTQRNDIPLQIKTRVGPIDVILRTTDTDSPFTYTVSNYTYNYVIVLTGTRPVKTGEFSVPDSFPSGTQLQKLYTDDGYEGNITYNA